MFSNIWDVQLSCGHGGRLGCCGGAHHQGNVDVILVGEDAGVALPSCEVRMEWRGNRAIYGLECGEEERVIVGR